MKGARKHFRSHAPTRGGAPGHKYLNQYGRLPHQHWCDELGCPRLVCPVHEWGRSGNIEREVAILLRTLDTPPARARAERTANLAAARIQAEDDQRLAAQAIPDGHKRCPTCNETKPLDQFSGKKRLVYCRDCDKKRKAQDRAADTEGSVIALMQEISGDVSHPEARAA